MFNALAIAMMAKTIKRAFSAGILSSAQNKITVDEIMMLTIEAGSRNFQPNRIS